MGRRPAGTKPPRGLGGSWRLPREPLCLTCLGLATPLSSLPGCCVCPLSSGPTEAPALESYHPTLLGDASLSPGTPRTSQRPQPVLSRCPCWAHHSRLQGWPWRPLCPSPELEELSEHRSCERPSVGPAALLWSPCSEAARPALPCWAQGARACQGRLRQLGSHWAPAGDGWPPPWCCLRAPLHPLPGASSQPRHQTLPTRTSGPPPLPVPSHDPASRPSGLLLGSGRMWQRQDHRSQLRVAGGCGIPVLSRKQP